MTQTDEVLPSGDVERWLAPSEFCDHEHPAVRAFAERHTSGTSGPTEAAVALFLAVRDGLWYDPYSSDLDRSAFKASTVVGLERSWCVPKSILLTAVARAVGIPARLGFADVRNHLHSEKLITSMGTDLFVFHGYSELLLDGRWRKASPAFNIELCRRFGTRVLDFNGIDDALFHPFDEAGNRHMEYVRQRGSYDEFPYEEMVAAFDEVYGDDSMPAGGGAERAGDDAFAPAPVTPD
ncbi:MAG: transglutaminase family protein [Actinomycetota bacterium]